MSSAQGYSLWLMPPKEIYQELSLLIHEIANQYKTPCFEPHITLIPKIQASEKEVKIKAEHISQKIKTFKVRLTHLEILERYFRCIFLVAEQNTGLMEANQLSRKIFEQDDQEAFFPHLSIIYGDLSASLKAQIQEEIFQKMKNRLPLEWGINSLCLYKTSGEVSQWKQIREYPLQP